MVGYQLNENVNEATWQITMSLLCGGTAGSLGIFIGQPFELIKVFYSFLIMHHFRIVILEYILFYDWMIILICRFECKQIRICIHQQAHV